MDGRILSKTSEAQDLATAVLAACYPHILRSRLARNGALHHRGRLAKAERDGEAPDPHAVEEKARRWARADQRHVRGRDLKEHGRNRRPKGNRISIKKARCTP